MPLAAADTLRGGGSSSSSTPNAGTASNDDAPAAASSSAATRDRSSSSRVAAAAAANSAATTTHPGRDSSAAAADAAPPVAAPSNANRNSNAAAAAASSLLSPRPAAPPSISSSTSTTRTSRASALLSRLNLPSFPVRSRNRNVVDFHIRPDEPHKTYNAGDTVRGHVNIAVVKSIRITHLVVALHGYIHNFKDASAKAKASASPISPRGGISELPQYHGNGLASLFQDEQVLAGEGRLDAGRYEFGFELIFPDIGLPSSIDVRPAQFPSHAQIRALLTIV